MVEETVFVKVNKTALPPGKDWQWLGDGNVIAIARNLSLEEKARVLDEVSNWWRRAHLNVVNSA